MATLALEEVLPFHAGARAPTAHLAPAAVERINALLTESQQLLFDLERADLLLGKALKPLYTAIKQGDRKGIRSLLAPDFEATVPTVPKDVGDAKRDVTYRFATDSSAGKRLDSSGFLSWIGDLHDQFKNCLLYTSPSPRD